MKKHCGSFRKRGEHMPHYSRDEIERAKSIDLLTYLKRYDPAELVRVSGGTYCTREHDSLRISNGKWMWWSRGIGGVSALDYLIDVKGMRFPDAMKMLTDGGAVHAPDLFSENRKRDPICRRREFVLPDRSETNLEVIKYLRSRGIDKDIIRDCITEGLIYESEPYHSCIFVGLDEAGREAYACYRATGEKRIVGEAFGSDKRYAFRIDVPGRTVHVFESAIDLLSYATVMKMDTGNWRAEPMISLGGVGTHGSGKPASGLPAALMSALERNRDIREIALHLDTDEAGRAASCSISRQLRNCYKVRDEPPPAGKDCNDYLMYIRSRRLSKERTDPDL